MKKTRAFPFPVKSGLNPKFIIYTNKFKKKKKKKSRGGGNIIINSDPCSIYTTSTNNNKSKSGIVIDGDLVVHEILTRLPVKSLFRFKSVCKLWDSIIGKDPNFINLHLTRSKSRTPSLFIIPFEDPPRYPRTTFFSGGRLLYRYYLNKLFKMAGSIEEERGGASINTITYSRKDSYKHSFDTISNPVNGLICFIDSQDRNAVLIYNISTQKQSPWIKNLLKEGEQDLSGSEYQFGFDSATNKPKLVCVRPTRYRKEGEKVTKDVVCDVLTLGEGDQVGDDNSNKIIRWRRINEVPPYQLQPKRPSVYVNGSIYWSTGDLNRGGTFWRKKRRPIFIVAFDVESEKFRAIPIPDFILDQPRKRSTSLVSPYIDDINGPNVDLLEVGGRVALQIKMSSYVIKLWIFDDDKKENMTTTNQQNWTEVTINLPFRWGRDRFVRLYSVLDQIILTTQVIMWDDHFKVKKEKSFSFYSYNWKKKNISEVFEISGIPSQMCSILLFTTFNESLLPVPNLRDIAHPLLNFKRAKFQKRKR